MNFTHRRAKWHKMCKAFIIILLYLWVFQLVRGGGGGWEGGSSSFSGSDSGLNIHGYAVLKVFWGVSYLEKVILLIVGPFWWRHLKKICRHTSPCNVWVCVCVGVPLLQQHVLHFLLCPRPSSFHNLHPFSLRLSVRVWPSSAAHKFSV